MLKRNPGIVFKIPFQKIEDERMYYHIGQLRADFSRGMYGKHTRVLYNIHVGSPAYCAFPKDFLM